MKKIKDLKVGDAVVVYQEYSERYTPNQREVAKNVLYVDMSIKN